jgi:hypothetical protein
VLEYALDAPEAAAGEDGCLGAYLRGLFLLDGLLQRGPRRLLQ